MRWISFDCFGTLVDWNGGFAALFEPLAGDRTGDLLRAYHLHETQVEREPYRPYRDVTREALVLAAREAGVDLAPARSSVIAQNWASLPVFEDTRPALRALRESGWNLAVLTNCDDDLFALTQQCIGVPFDTVITAQQVRSYKPAHAHFERFAQNIQSHDVWVHAARSWFHDIAPARELGITRIWIDRDRTGEDPAAATAVLPDLRGLASLVRELTLR